VKLKTIKVTNFRSVEDSGDLSLENITCLVGKNEAGKSAILQAIAGLHPDILTPMVYDKERDYPRRFLTEYKIRHPNEEAVVITSSWELEAPEKALIATEFGDGALTSSCVTILRRYASPGPEWTLPFVFSEALKHLLDAEELEASEREPLSGITNSAALVAALSNLPSRTAKQEHLLSRLQQYPSGEMERKVQSLLEPGLPRFMYFSYYDRMSGQVQVQQLKQDRDQGILGQTDKAGDGVFLDFLKYVGTSLEEIESAATYESLNARCEAASNRITDQIFEYWSQNTALEIEVRVTRAEQNDPPPFNTGTIVRARVKNNIHKVTVPFSERSAGFIWFFSFLVKFAQVRKKAGAVILLLDEPGLSLHGKAQSDLLRYFAEKLAPNHQVIYSAHSPFMVPPDNLASVRIVEDVVVQNRLGRLAPLGTKIRDDVLSTDPDTIFPLQGALGYEITQTLFIGKHTLLVEGPSDIVYLQCLSAALKRRRRRVGLDPRWTICPSGGIDKIHAFVSLFKGNTLDVAVLTDQGAGEKSKIERLRASKVLEAGRVFSIAEQLGKAEADIEDILEPGLLAEIVNQAYGLPDNHKLSASSLLGFEPNTIRLVKKVEAAFRVMPSRIAEFDHFTPADWLIRNPSVLDEDTAEVRVSLERAEKLFVLLNGLLTVAP
jgi:predicted ATP-dependent endonuclease of OLD family